MCVVLPDSNAALRRIAAQEVTWCLHPSFRSLFFLPSRSLFDFKVWAAGRARSVQPTERC